MGNQTTLSNTTTPIASSTNTDLNYDLTIDFLTGGVSKVLGVVNITKITTTVAGFSTNVTTGLGPLNVNETGTYTCPPNSTSTSGSEVTVIEDGITTRYTLNYTSDKSGTFVTSVTGTKDGATIDASSNGTFTEL